MNLLMTIEPCQNQLCTDLIFGVKMVLIVKTFPDVQPVNTDTVKIEVLELLLKSAHPKMHTWIDLITHTYAL